VQSGPQQSYALGADLRYAHSPAYLAAEAGRAGFTVAHLEAASSRRDAGRDVPGLVVVLRWADVVRRDLAEER
jgi:predicted TPR repeat methyltransferase